MVNIGKKTILAIALAAIIIIVSFTAYLYTRPAAVAQEITIGWTEGPESDYLESRLSEFTADTGIQVNLLVIPREHIVERLMLEMLKPTGKIDGTMMACIESSSLAATGKLVDLYDYKPRSKWIEDGFYETQLTTNEINGSLYFAPGIWNGAMCFAYEADYFENQSWINSFMAWPNRTMNTLRPPNNPEEWVELAKFFHESQNEKNAVCLMLKEEMGSGCYKIFLPMADYYGGGIYNATTGEILANKTGTIKALDLICELNQYAQPTSLVDGTFEGQVNVLEGRGIMHDFDSWMIPMLNDTSISKVAGKMKLAPRSFGQMPDMLGIAILDGPKKDLVWKFVNWTVSPDISTGLVLVTPKAPNQVAVTEDPQIEALPYMSVIVDSYGGTQPLVQLIKDPRVVEIYTSVMYHFQEAVSGTSTPEAACQAIADDIVYITSA